MSWWTRTVEPVLEPLSLADAKLHARITQDAENAILRSYLVTARQAAESYMNRGLLTQTWQHGLECFSECLYLPMAHPLQNDPLTTSEPIVQYYDVDGTLQTLDASFYVVDASSRPGSIHRASGKAWPALQADRSSTRVIITYVVGWTTVALVPERIKQGIRLYLTMLDRNRDGLEPLGEMARKSAEACWDDVVQWIEPRESWRLDA